MVPRSQRRRAFRAIRFAARHVGELSGLILAFVVTAPLLAPGFILSYDMAFVPRPRLSRVLLGVSGTPPRSVPSALIVALLSRALTGEVVEKLILVSILALATFGAARLVPSDRATARVAGGVLYAWNPFTYERLLAGHWALLLGYAVLPWVAAAALRFRRGDAGATGSLFLALFLAMVPSPYTGILAGAVAGAISLSLPWKERLRAVARRAAVLLGAVVAANLPWLVPALLGPAVPERPLLATALFRARSDSPLGTIGSLLSLGGLWRSDLAPPGRSAGLWIPAFVLIAVLTGAGWARLGGRWPGGAAPGILAVAAAGVLLAAAPSVAGLDAVSRRLSGLAGGGILRDSQKFVIPLALAASVGFGLGVERVLQALPRTDRLLRRSAAALAILPVALAPTLAWGESGRLFASRYPSSWGRVESIVASDPGSGGILALPWHAFLPFGWNRDRAVHQPALQYFSRPVLSSSSLEVGPYRLPDEDPWAGRAAPVVEGMGPLAPGLHRLGVRYVVVFKEADWRREPPRLTGLTPLFDAPDLRLYRSPLPAGVPSFPAPPLGVVLVGDLLTAVVVGGAGWAAYRSARARPDPSNPNRGPDILQPPEREG
jgi:hypothetical protein